MREKTEKIVQKLGGVGRAIRSIVASFSNFENLAQVGRMDSAERMLQILGGITATPDVLECITTLFDYLSRTWHREHEVMRAQAEKMILHLGSAAASPKILARLTEWLREGKGDSPLNILRNIGSAAATDEVLECIAKLLGDKDQDSLMGAGQDDLFPGRYEQTQCRAAKAISILEVGNPVTVTRLTYLLHNEKVYPWLRLEAGIALGRLGSIVASPEFLSKLAASLTNTNDYVREASAYAVEGLENLAATPEILTPLTKLLWDDNHIVRAVATRAIGHMGNAAATPEILARLCKLLESDMGGLGTDDVGQSSAAKALGHLGSLAATGEVLTRLKEMLSDENREVREGAIRGIGRIGSAAATPEILEHFAKILCESDPRGSSRALVVRALGYMGSKTVKQYRDQAAMLEMLDCFPELLFNNRHDDEDLERAVGFAVRRLREDLATPAILATLADRASNSLGWIGILGLRAATPDVLACLYKLWNDQRDSFSKGEVANVLGQMMVEGIRFFERQPGKWERLDVTGSGLIQPLCPPP